MSNISGQPVIGENGEHFLKKGNSMKQKVFKSARYAILGVATPFLVLAGLSAFVVCLFLNRRESGCPVVMPGREAALSDHRS